MKVKIRFETNIDNEKYKKQHIIEYIEYRLKIIRGIKINNPLKDSKFNPIKETVWIRGNRDNH